MQVDDNRFLAERYQLVSIPALKVFVGGEVDTAIVGAKPKAALEADLFVYLR